MQTLHKFEDANKPKKRTFRTFHYRGIELDKLLELNQEELVKLLPARQRRKFRRGIDKKAKSLLKKLRKAKKECEVGEKPKPIPTHLRNMTIIPEMVGSIVAVHNGKQYTNVEIKPEMIGYYLGEFSITYKHTRHGKPGIGATHSSRFIPLK
ncbi:ribosomal protein S19 [Plasmodium yoelii yoelii]|uniref:Ribosomal protein S19 n=1 Tax=Plasmodium yoelii yoelii TaxID=73239 RepID=Q7RT13_PLAYO|nr:ribosomal protein S19 [Plasmodium yoelii yoelii]